MNKTASGGHSVFIIKTREGLFSKEYYLQEVSVEIIDENDFSAAVKGVALTPTDYVVTTEVASLINGERVRLMNAYL